jgi:hypothetical protein
MRKIIGFAAIVGLGLLTPALAEAPKSDAKATASPSALVAKADEMGYDVRSVRERHGLYHANLLDRETGGAIHAEFRTADGELMSARIAAADKDRDVREHDDDRSSHAGGRHDRDDDRN